MRATLVQALRADHYGTRREQLVGWWVDWPCRHRAFWSLLLLDKGQGWLRWGTDERCTYGSYDPPEPPEFYDVAPPLRRFCWWSRVKVCVPFNMIRLHLSREEVTCSWGDMALYVDPDRRRELWLR